MLFRTVQIKISNGWNEFKFVFPFYASYEEREKQINDIKERIGNGCDIWSVHIDVTTDKKITKKTWFTNLLLTPNAQWLAEVENYELLQFIYKLYTVHAEDVEKYYSRLFMFNCQNLCFLYYDKAWKRWEEYNYSAHGMNTFYNKMSNTLHFIIPNRKTTGHLMLNLCLVEYCWTELYNILRLSCTIGTVKTKFYSAGMFSKSNCGKTVYSFIYKQLLTYKNKQLIRLFKNAVEATMHTYTYNAKGLLITKKTYLTFPEFTRVKARYNWNKKFTEERI